MRGREKWRKKGRGKKNPRELLEHLLSPEDPNQSIFLFQKQDGMCLLNLVQNWKPGIYSLRYKILRRPVTKLEKEFIITQTLIFMTTGTLLLPFWRGNVRPLSA